MWKVDIYLETDSTFQGKRERKCGYVLSTMVGNEEKTKENFGISNGTYHQYHSGTSERSRKQI